MKTTTKKELTKREIQEVANMVIQNQLEAEMLKAMDEILANAEAIVKDLGSKINILTELSKDDLEDTCNQTYEHGRIISQNLEALEDYTSRLYPNPLFAEEHN